MCGIWASLNYIILPPEGIAIHLHVLIYIPRMLSLYKVCSEGTVVKFEMRNELLLNAKEPLMLSRELCKLTPSGLIRPTLTELKIASAIKEPKEIYTFRSQ